MHFFSPAHGMFKEHNVYVRHLKHTRFPSLYLIKDAGLCRTVECLFQASGMSVDVRCCISPSSCMRDCLGKFWEWLAAGRIKRNFPSASVGPAHSHVTVSPNKKSGAHIMFPADVFAGPLLLRAQFLLI